ncbi:MAG: DUF4350 domain-containing protein [Anaerolineae bacterium]|nr:DUF4350 domain-containing protein [Thermoflexales bacterium]MDW8406166.1 DUF4350 domain-containing protein [Anaerolineae bacterium]
MKSTSTASAWRSNFMALIASLAVLLAGAVISAGLQLGMPDGPPLSARAYGVTGSVALARWHEALGFRVRLIEGRPFQLPAEARLLYVLQPNTRYEFTDDELEVLHEWVEAGGILVLAGEATVSYPVTRRGPTQYAALDESPIELFGFEMDIFNTSLLTATWTQPPAAPSPAQPFRWRRETDEYALALDLPDDAIIHALVDGEVIAASRQVGRGRVFVFAGTYPFTNDGLRNEANAQFILNLTALVPPNSLIAFDEFHHGARQTPSLLGWMFSAPAGLATALALALIGAYIAWTGRRFGRAFVPRELRIHREPSEYVLALANLSRAAGQRNAALLRYHAWLKRKLARPYRLDPSMPDHHFVAALQRVGAPLDYERLARLLSDLQRGASSAAQFVRLAREVAEF